MKKKLQTKVKKTSSAKKAISKKTTSAKNNKKIVSKEKKTVKKLAKIKNVVKQEPKKIQKQPSKPIKQMKPKKKILPQKTKSVEEIQDSIDVFVASGKKHGAISYEKVMAFGEELGLSESEMNNLLKKFDRVGIELLMQEDIADDSSLAEYEDEEQHPHKIKQVLDSSLDIEGKGDLDDDEFADDEIIKGSETSQVADGVKAFLRDIGKIPLLNKKTEQVIASKIAEGKSESVDAITQFPFVTKELLLISERLQKNSIALKDIIQFSEFDEENLPKLEEEKKNLLKTIKQIKNLIDNEAIIYQSYKGKLTSEKTKQEMLDKIKENKQAIIDVIKSIKFANKLIRKLGKRIEKNIQKIHEKEDQIKGWEKELKKIKDKAAHQDAVNELDKNIRMATKSIKNIESELGLAKNRTFSTYKQFVVGQIKDKEAKDDLARANLRLVVNIAKNMLIEAFTF